MRQATAYTLVLLICVQSFYQAGLVSWFYANQSSIAMAHCVNLNKPQLHCDGKCFLAKKLKEAEKENAAGQSTNNNHSELQVFVLDEKEPVFIPFVQLIVHFPHKIQFIQRITGSDIFHPPAC
jgi:hypothetical protein